MLAHDHQTIIACCTPTGKGALALLRISGDDALSIASSMSRLVSAKSPDTVPSHTIHYGWVTDADQNRIDQVLFMVMHAPKTFTGQHTVEITCHNNPFIIEAIIERALACGARLAQEGEFSKRAVLHDKIDLLQAEAIHELISAQTQQALKSSMAQLEGSLSQQLQVIEKQLIKLLALSEASFEFIDEEDMAFGEQIKAHLTAILKTITILKKQYNQQQQIREGIRIALIGSVNAGKSSLFNALLAKNRAIVTNIAGTTRDVIEAGMYRHGMYITLADTAGLRQTKDVIEQVGIQRSHQEAHKADIILLIIDTSRKLTQQEQTIYQELYDQYQHKIMVVTTKSDLPSNSIPFNNSLPVSSTTKKNIEHLETAFIEKANKLLATANSPFLLNKRQYTLLTSLEKQLNTLLPMLEDNIHYELVSHHLTEAISCISELTGKTVSEQGMDAIFREFCVGK